MTGLNFGKAVRRVTLTSSTILVLGLAAHAQVVDPELEFTPDERRFVDEFVEALERFDNMSLDEFIEDYTPRRAYLTEGAPLEFRRGDANRDEGVDTSDALCVLLYLFSGRGPCASPDCADALDFDDSGSVELTDAIGLLAYLFSGGAAPPPPAQEFGFDPTEDDLACALENKLGYEPLESEFLHEIFTAWLPSVRQEEAFRENGFVVYDNVKFDSMLRGYFEIYRRDLPVYISVDSIVDALHLSFDRMLIKLEEGVLFGEIDEMLARMETGIEHLQTLVPGTDIGPALDDVALWVCVARSLLHGEDFPCARAMDGDAEEIVELARDAESLLELSVLGAKRRIDFSHFRIRGHYSRSEKLGRYFKAMMWIQRIGLEFTNIERPGDTQLAALLARLLEDTGAIENWRAVNETVAHLVGISDSLNPPGLTGFMNESGFSMADLWDDALRGEFVTEALVGGIGRQRINSAFLQYNPRLAPPGGFMPFPRLFHVMGQRFVIDSYIFQNVTFDRVGALHDPRLFPSTLDAWFVLGNRTALPLMEGELRRWDRDDIERLHPKLAALDWLVSTHSPDFWMNDRPDGGGGAVDAPISVDSRDFWSENLYNVWLSSLRELDVDTTSDRFPPAMRTETWQRRMLNAQLASWAHLRHDTILYAKPSFPPNGCYYPDGWVDPYPEFYERIAEFARRAREVPMLRSLATNPSDYFGLLEHVMTELAGIARAELAGDALSPAQSEFVKRWIRQQGYREQPIGRVEPDFNVLDGWYPRIIFEADREGGEGFDPTIADVHQAFGNGTHGGVLEVGVGHPRLMLLSVENECGTRAYVGPVLSYHEFIEPLADRNFVRWTDEEWKEALESGYDAPRPEWVREFVK